VNANVQSTSVEDGNVDQVAVVDQVSDSDAGTGNSADAQPTSDGSATHIIAIIGVGVIVVLALVYIIVSKKKKNSADAQCAQFNMAQEQAMAGMNGKKLVL